MARDCIICGKPAGSREHIFPAALGGWRTNKGIYCGPHNEGFSPLAAVLAEQLRAINALLSVRPDHSSTACALVVDGPGGQALEVSGTKVKLAPPAVAAPIADGEVRELAFGSEAEAQEWVKRQKDAGYDVTLTKKEWQTRYFAEPMHISLSLGGSEGLRAAGYVALTFFAHHFSALARDKGWTRSRRMCWETKAGSLFGGRRRTAQG